jgi:ketosteroid isomerase-like protein
MSSTSTATVGGVVSDYVAGVNAFDLDAVLATFADDALVNDVQREFWGRDAIRRWVASEMVGAKVTLDVTTIKHHAGTTIVTAQVDGEYDKTNVPDPLVLTFYFTVQEDKIAQLIILHNRPVSEPKTPT